MGLTINTVLLGGHLTRDPEVKRVGEQAVANFGIAMNHRTKGPSGEIKETVVFVDLEAWGRTAELVGQYLTKGSACVIEGRLKYEAWQDQGKNRSKLKVVAEKVQFVGGTRSEHDGSQRDLGAEAEPQSDSQPSSPAAGKPAATQAGATPAGSAGRGTQSGHGQSSRAGNRTTGPGQRRAPQPAGVGDDEPPF